MILGVSGKSKHGKDTVASYLESSYGFRVTSFAQSLKDATKLIYGWDDRHVYGDLKEVRDPFWGKSPREVMQLFGTECGRDILDPNLWVKSLRRRLDTNFGANWVIPDVRFPNEAEAIKNWGGKIIRVSRDIVSPVGIVGHPSETSLDDYKFDAYIANNGALWELYPVVDDVMKFLDIHAVW